MAIRRQLTYTAAVTVTAIALMSAQASGTVVPLGGGWQAEIPDGFPASIDVGHAGLDYLQIWITAEFAEPPEPDDSFSPLKISFEQILPDADTAPEIKIDRQYITNQTGAAWTGYQWMILGGADVWVDAARSSGMDVRPFTDMTFADSYGFVDPNQATDLVVDGGVVPNNTTFFPGAWGRGGGPFVISADLDGADPVEFTLEQVPIPEAALTSALTLVAALIGLRAGRRR